MTTDKLTELRRACEYELAPLDTKCPECDFPKSYRHKYGCEFPVFHEDPAAILDLLDTLEKATEVIRFYGDGKNWIAQKDMAYSYIRQDGGKKAKEFLASLEDGKTE